MTNRQELSISDERLAQIHQGIQGKKDSRLRLVSDALWLIAAPAYLPNRALSRHDEQIRAWGQEIAEASSLGVFESWMFSMHFARRIDMNIAAQNSDYVARAVYSFGIKRNAPGFFAHLTKTYDEIHDDEEHKASVRASNIWGVNRQSYYEWTHTLRRSALKLGSDFYLAPETDAQNLRQVVLFASNQIALARPTQEEIEAVESGLLL